MSIRISRQLSSFMDASNYLKKSFGIIPLIRNNLDVSLGYFLYL